MEKIKLGFDLSVIAEVFSIVRVSNSVSLSHWLEASYVLTTEENHIIDKIYEEISEDGDYWNEAELKIKSVGLLFFLADIAVKNQIKIFYERPLSAHINDYYLSVIADCMVATPMAFNAPKHPYFFYKSLRKAKEKKEIRKLKCCQQCSFLKISIKTINPCTAAFW